MRKLFILLLFLAMPPVLVVFAFTQHNIEVPEIVYEIKDPEIIIEDELSRILAKETSGIETLRLSEAAFNNLIFNNLRLTSNASYAPPGWACEDSSCRYAIRFNQDVGQQSLEGGIVAIWAHFEEDSFTLYIQAEAVVGVTLPTLLVLTFEVDDSAETLILSYDTAKLGRTPIPKRLISTIISRALAFTGEDETMSIGEELTIDISELTFTLDKTSLTESGDIDPRLATLFLDEDIPYSLWVFLIWLALDL